MITIWFLYFAIWLSKWGLGKSIGCTLKISGHRVVLVVPQLTHVFYNGFKIIVISRHFQPIISCSGSNQSECGFILKPTLWLFEDLFLKVGKWVLNCAAGVKLVVRWFIAGIVSAHALQIRCYRWHKIRVIMIEKIIVPDYFLDQCKNWLRDLCDHNSDILRVLQNLKFTLGLWNRFLLDIEIYQSANVKVANQIAESKWKVINENLPMPCAIG